MSSNSHVFISHASSDAKFAQAVADELTLLRIPVWVAPDSIPPGHDYASAIEAAISSADAVFVIVTHASNASREVLKEIELANRMGVPTLAIVVGDSIEPAGGLSYHLSAGQWVRISGLGEIGAHISELQVFLRSVSLGSEGRTSWGAKTAAIQPQIDVIAQAAQARRAEKSAGGIAGAADDALALPVGAEVKQLKIERMLHKSHDGFVYLAARRGDTGSRFMLKELFPHGLADRDSTKGAVVWGRRLKNRPARAFREEFLREVGLKDSIQAAGFVATDTALRANNTHYKVRPYISGVTLRDLMEGRLGSFSAGEAMDMFALLLQLIGALHAANVVHCDITPSNVLIRENHSPTLIDFGSARVRTSNIEPPRSHTPGFAPPEIRHGDAESALKIGPPSDIYSAAAIVYSLVNGNNADLAVAPDMANTLIREKYFPWQLVSAVTWSLTPDAAGRPDNAKIVQSHWTATATPKAGAQATLGRGLISSSRRAMRPRSSPTSRPSWNGQNVGTARNRPTWPWPIIA